MTAPSPTPGSANPFTQGYQSEQFPSNVGDPTDTVADSLTAPPSTTINSRVSSVLTARTKSKYKSTS
jgi:hypothetical protein